MCLPVELSRIYKFLRMLINKPDLHSCCPVCDLAFDSDSFVDTVVDPVVSVVSRIQTYFANGGTTFFRDHMALDLTKKSHDLVRHRHHNAILDLIATIYRANHIHVDLSHKPSGDLSLFAYVPMAIRFLNNAQDFLRPAKPFGKCHQIFFLNEFLEWETIK